MIDITLSLAEYERIWHMAYLEPIVDEARPKFANRPRDAYYTWLVERFQQKHRERRAAFLDGGRIRSERPKTRTRTTGMVSGHQVTW